ncbi:hypothetical protein PsW64_02568 [Pseudovibrio sp. W64]|uniref:hypothetical protein n=1 Tax=Pseudovibrio sp. W64 TaxID=1735583 RepID=UPI0007AEDF78|nr:hypothetical protein [Pseudovibrio sp. W64]KZK81484.1 hypothetical protein PsW64_02568 [Pseudovibrio sp. W64]
MQIDHLSQYFTTGYSIGKNAQRLSATPMSADFMSQPAFRDKEIERVQGHFELSVMRLNQALDHFDAFDKRISTHISRHESGGDGLNVLMSMAQTPEDKIYYENLIENREREYNSWLTTQTKLDDPDYKIEYLEQSGFFDDIAQYFPDKTPDDIKELYKQGADFSDMFNPAELLDASIGVFTPDLHWSYQPLPI